MTGSRALAGGTSLSLAGRRIMSKYLSSLLPRESRRGWYARLLYRAIRYRDLSLLRSISPFGTIDVSVIVPVYNAERYMRRCLDSLRDQRGVSLEFICVNDGSTDHSLAILHEYSSYDRRFLIIDQENKGYGAALNVGIRHARGAFIATLDPDDWIERDAYAKLFKASQSQGVDIVKANYWEVTEGSEYIREQFGAFPYLVPLSLKDHKELLLTIPTIWAAIYRREFIVDRGLFLTERPGSSYQDAAFCLRAWLSANKVLLMPEAFVHYWNDRVDSATNSGGFPFAVCEEFRVVEDWLEDVPELCTQYMPIVYVRKLETYRWNFNRLTDIEKQEFCRIWSSEYVRAQQKGWIQRSLYTESAWKLLRQIISYPDEVAKREKLRF